jgi:hypothetical protein
LRHWLFQKQDNLLPFFNAKGQAFSLKWKGQPFSFFPWKGQAMHFVAPCSLPTALVAVVVVSSAGASCNYWLSRLLVKVGRGAAGPLCPSATYASLFNFLVWIFLKKRDQAGAKQESQGRSSFFVQQIEHVMLFISEHAASEELAHW